MTTVELRGPVADGVKAMLTVQFALTAKLAGQVLALMAKSPEVLIELIVTATVPELAMVMFWGALVVLMVCPGNVSDVGEMVMVGVAGGLPVPLRVTD